MPVGEKRLRCYLLVRAESTPGTLAVSGPSLRDCNELPSPTTASPVGTQSSCASMSGIKQEKRRSAINRENRAKLKIVHTSGARSFQRMRALLEKMEAYCHTQSEIFAEVFGMKVGYVRGLGRSVRSVGSSSSVSSVDLSRDWRRPD
ncbi:hypothetical protein CJ030_MR5G023960 [Morella rubra]|uniref:Uncharacterized protein n=1 Tax=Morella rubra TaxID=262757 RepID=A0A6A1VKR9_9ROSI|nr:hypothetical protein CJ030_MR5G023960 [Morella rubra]